MANDITFSLGLEDDSVYLSQLNQALSNIGQVLSSAKLPMPSFDFAAFEPPKIDFDTFDVASASVGELEKAYEQLRTSFTAGGDTTLLTQVEESLRSLNSQLRETREKSDKKPFDMATASASELQKELARLQREFRSGMDTTQIVNIRNRLRDVRVEMGQISGQTFIEKLKAAFDQSLSDATDWQQSILEIAGGNIIANLFENLGNSILDAGKFAIQSAGKFESIRASLDVMTGSLEKGGMIFKQFQTLASKSPFNFDDVAEQGTKLLAMGIPIEDITNRLSRIGDVAAGVGREKLPSIVYAYGQIKSQGKAMAGDISQFINAGVPIIETLAETLKKPQEQIKQLASAGKIGFKDIDAALLAMTNQGGKFFEMMKTQSNTFEGLWSSMEDAFQLLGVAIGNQVLPIVKDIVIGITNAVNVVTDFLNTGENVDAYATTFGNVATAIAKVIAMAISPVFKAFGSILGFIMDNALSLTLIVGGLALAVNALTIAAKINAATIWLADYALIAWEATMEFGANVAVFLIEGLIAMETAFAGLTLETIASTAASAAFWLISNPAGWLVLAGGIAAAAGAYFLFNKESAAAAEKNKIVADITTQLIDRYTEERTKIDGLFKVLSGDGGKRTTQIQAVKTVTDSFGKLLPKYDEEKLGLKETEQAAKEKKETQQLAAKAVIDSYRDILPSYITEKLLLEQSAAGDRARADAQEVLRTATLRRISEELRGEIQLQIAKDAIKNELDRQITIDAYKRVKEQGGMAQSLFIIEKWWNNQTMADYDKKNQTLKSTAEAVGSEYENIFKRAKEVTDKMDFGGGFDEKALKDGVGGAAAFAANSLKGLQERLKIAREELETLNPASNAFAVAAKKVNALEDAIKNVNDRLKLMGLNSESLAGLQARLSIVQENLSKASPDSENFDKAIAKTVELNAKIKILQDRIKEGSLVGGSMEMLNFQLSQLTENLNKQPSGSSLIPTLREDIKKLNKETREFKIELGLEAPHNSFSGMQNDLSELNKQLSELPTNAPISTFNSLSQSAISLSKAIKEIDFKKSLAATEIGSLSNLELQLSHIKEQIKETPAGSNLIESLITQSKVLENKISDVNNKFNLLSLVNGSLAYLQASLSIIEGKIQNTNPNDSVFAEMVKQTVELNRQIKDAQNNAKELTLSAGSIDFISFKQGNISDKISSLPKGSEEIPPLIEQYKELNKQMREARVAAGLDAPFRSLDGISTTISEINKQISEMDFSAPISDIERLSAEARTLKDDLSVREYMIHLATPGENPIDDVIKSVGKASLAYAEFFGVTGANAVKFAQEMETMSNQIKEALAAGISQGIGSAAEAFGKGIGDMIMGFGTFQDAVVGGLMALSKVFLVEIPKAIGMIMIQEAVKLMIASSGFASPLAIPLLVGGLALVGASGLFGGILGGLQKKYDAKNEKKVEIPNVNQSTSGSTNGQRALGPGASSLSADKSVFQPVINITIDNSIDGISNLIVKRIQAENELNK